MISFQMMAFCLHSQLSRACACTHVQGCKGLLIFE